ncbi:MAG TPA: nitroreductase family protein [Facklamia tabacinasalis]|uniref:nitroreductase family protein n=1 Tax=Ruoffia tabacinasalis TaxID=87458 RepID=UPI001D253665|nr:nitroreductase family protein [Ruoffia tabacinasalis]
MSQFTDLVKKRRTVYGLGNNTDLTKEEIVSRIREVAREIPSASNSQTTRLVVLFGEDNVKFWDHILDVQKDVMQGAMWDMFSGVMEGAKGAVGTILFFEDHDAVKEGLGEGVRAETYKHHNDANMQFSMWLALAELNLGASLQHMNIGFEQGFDKSVKELFDLPASYEMVAQMPFGSIEGTPGEKEYIDDEVRVTVIGE